MNYTLLESLLYKNKLAQVSDAIEACYLNDQPETRKTSELACSWHDALSSNIAVLISQPTAKFSDANV